MRGRLARIVAVVAVWAGVNALGGYLFRRSRRRHAGFRRHFLVTQGGSEVRPTGEEIQDAVVSVMMGGAVLDLRDASPPRRPARLDVMIVMGGVQLLVPEDWRVQIEVEALMGGIQDARDGQADQDRPVDLVLEGRVVFGGLDISSRTKRLREGVR